MKSHGAVLSICGLSILLSAAVWAADEPAKTPANPPASKLSPLGVRQQRVERMMDDFDRTFKNLAQSLEKTEPQRAARLLKAIEESKQLLIQQRMGEIGKLLNDTRLDTATDEQKKILGDLARLLDILLKEDNPNDELQEAVRLEEIKKELGRVLEEERQHRTETSKLANKDQTLADLARQIAQIKSLIEQQQNLLGETEKSKGEPRAHLPLADRQQQIRQKTQALAREIGGPPAAGAGDSGEKKEGAGKEGAGKEGAGKEGAGKEGAGKESSSGAAGGQQPGANPAAQSLDNAAGKQQSAASNLAEGKPKAAIADEQQAVDELKKALGALEKEKSRIASLPKEHSKEIAKQQDRTTDRTAKLNSEMKKPSPSGGQSGGSQGGGKSGDGQSGGGKPTPGQKSVEQAQQSMQDASDQLNKDDSPGAAQNQDQAISKLEDALKEIEKRLAQLREQLQMDKLARLETRFREMLERQKKVTPITAELDKARKSDGQFTRPQRLELSRQAEEEAALAELGQAALEIIVEDGTSVVFPEIVANVRDDLKRLADLLGTQKTDSYTQLMQKEVETTLGELIASLQKAQKKKKGGGGGGGGGGGQDEPLLPNSAELKLLKAAQVRVNRRTEAFGQAHASGPLDETAKAEVTTLGKRQQEISQMTQRIIERE